MYGPRLPVRCFDKNILKDKNDKTNKNSMIDAQKKKQEFYDVSFYGL